MSSRRPEEINRKVLSGTGYGDPSQFTVQDVHRDGTEAHCKASADFELGDWVCMSGLVDGYPRVAPASEDGAADWVGVVMHKVAADAWCKVKTTGVCLAKVEAGVTEEGASLGLESGSTEAVEFEEGAVCGRFLKRLTGVTTLAHVSLGGAGETTLLIHHHDDESNTKVKDTTSLPAGEARLWHLLKVAETEITGGPASNRLALAIGGSMGHGLEPTEGYAWGGVIGESPSMGIGQIGGGDANQKQGVLGAESDLSGDRNRINIRSWAGVNASDRYGPQRFAGFATTDCVGPIRYSPRGQEPTWQCSVEIDNLGLPVGALFWAGTMRPTTNPVPAGANAGWDFQWTPSMQVERDCIKVDALSPTTPPDFPCASVTNPARFKFNADDLSGAYEWVIPYGYTPCTGRLNVLEAIGCLSVHIQKLWTTMGSIASVLDTKIACLNTFVGATCCALPGTTVPTVECGPTSATCEASHCDVVPP